MGRGEGETRREGQEEGQEDRRRVARKGRGERWGREERWRGRGKKRGEREIERLTVSLCERSWELWRCIRSRLRKPGGVWQ